MTEAKWGTYPNFHKEEFNCHITGENKMTDEFMRKLQECRTLYAKPMIINSGYRSPSHPIERIKKVPGEHTEGMAADVSVIQSADRFLMVKYALAIGFKRIGITRDFVHIGLSERRSQNVIWIY